MLSADDEEEAAEEEAAAQLHARERKKSAEGVAMDLDQRTTSVRCFSSPGAAEEEEPPSSLRSSMPVAYLPACTFELLAEVRCALLARSSLLGAFDAAPRAAPVCVSNMPCACMLRMSVSFASRLISSALLAPRGLSAASLSAFRLAMMAAAASASRASNERFMVASAVSSAASLATRASRAARRAS